MFDEVLAALIGRVPEKTPTVAHGWRVVALPHRVYPGLVRTESATASGLLIGGLAPDEWSLIDAFEDEAYRLGGLELADGLDGWAYVCSDSMSHGESWDVERFRSFALLRYVRKTADWTKRYGAA
jgi:Gamma-glutamyl cyclotransferase, AIG2-like